MAEVEKTLAEELFRIPHRSAGGSEGQWFESTCESAVRVYTGRGEAPVYRVTAQSGRAGGHSTQGVSPLPEYREDEGDQVQGGKLTLDLVAVLLILEQY